MKLRRSSVAVFLWPLAITVFFLALYIQMQTTSIYGGDSGELVSAAYTWGIAHPPGYPLYILIAALLSHTVPIFTVAWRVGLVSSIPMAFSVYFLWKIVFRITQNIPSATISSLLYGLLYPVWLYAMVPEVFGLYALFSAVYIYTAIVWVESRRTGVLYALAFLSGLAMTHHHLMVLAIVAVLYTIYRFDKNTLIIIRKQILRFTGLFILGFLPYLYAPIASAFHPLFDWEHAATLEGFIRLITRSSYGTFRASGFTTGGIFHGIADSATFVQYIYGDFTLVGIVFVLAGVYFLWRKEKQLLVLLVGYLLLLFVYIFYAGFPVVSGFLIGTLERFFIIPYQVITIYFGLGVAFLLNSFSSTQRRFRVFLSVGLVVALCTLPYTQWKKNHMPLGLLTHDQTMEYLAADVFTSIPEGAVYGASGDTTNSSMDYAYFVKHLRPDIIFVNYALLSSSNYRTQLKIRYPSLRIPEWKPKMTIKDYLPIFFLENSKHAMLTSDTPFSSVSGFFVPSGLVYIYYPTLGDIPDRTIILDKNDRLWQKFHDPLSGVLGRYNHLLLTDVLRIYADQSIALSQAFALSGKYMEGARFISYALAHETNIRVESYKAYFDILMKQNQCLPARSHVDALHAKWGNDFVILELYHRIAGVCVPVDEALKEYDLLYGRLKPAYDVSVQ